MENQKWNIDDTHSEIIFKVKHMMVSNVSGAFEKFEGTAESNDDDFSNAKFTFKANIDSINTRNADRDAHLKSDDFFNAESYPQLKFESTSFEKDGDDYKLKGDLTIRDVTKEVELDVEFNGVAVDPYGQTKAGFELSGKINRKDFGLKWSAVTEAGSIVVSDEVKLSLNVQLVKQEVAESVEA
ncbi:MAG: hypothetical protein CMP59_01270 [Flavobacteriales bacterium]|nr:hypothetical protein [Flavobacteriales bacterium]